MRGGREREGEREIERESVVLEYFKTSYSGEREGETGGREGERE